MFGLGKQRTKLGRWLDDRGIKQEWLIKKSGVSKGTATNVCNDAEYVPSGKTIQRIMKALREVDPNVSSNKFWDI